MGCGPSRAEDSASGPRNPPRRRPTHHGAVYEGHRRTPSPTRRVAAYTYTAPPDSATRGRSPTRDRRNSTGGGGARGVPLQTLPTAHTRPRSTSTSGGSQLLSNANPFGGPDPSLVRSRTPSQIGSIGSIGSGGSTGTARRVNMYQESLHQLAGEERALGARGQQAPAVPAPAVVRGGGQGGGGGAAAGGSGGQGQGSRYTSGGSQYSGGSAPMSATSSVQRSASRRSGQGASGSGSRR